MQKILLSTLGLLIFGLTLNAQQTDTVSVDINLDVKHSVGDVSEFDRQKYMVLHGSLQEHDWNNEVDKMNYLFDTLNTYLGRDNGGINWWFGQSPEDPNRTGYADSNYVANQGTNRRNLWSNDIRNAFDHKSDVMIGGQTHAMWPGKKNGWNVAGPDAVGEYMARYIDGFYRDITDSSASNGHPAPRFLEVLNEPEYELHDDPNVPANDKVDLIDIFRFHRDVSKSFKKFNTTTKIGGYTVAFPYYDIDNFQRWEDRMKLFVDTAGADMDFYSLHFYDFNKHGQTGNTGHIHFKGSRTEATIDMLEQYNMMKFGEIKPLVISEYGGRDHSLEWNPWSPERDWVFLKAVSPLMMQFMERPNTIEKTIPFIMSKAAWSPTPHSWRLMRQAQEPAVYQQNNLSTPYVFTELIKFFELWSDVQGTRIDVWSRNHDVLSQAYVDNDKVHLILSNLSFDQQIIDLALMGQNGNSVQNVKVKHLHGVNNLPVLDVDNFDSLKTFTLDPEATAIIEYEFSSNVNINNTSDEVKYYASSYYQPIVANQAISFDIDNVDTLEHGEGILRLGFGRQHTDSKKPEVLFNGVKLNVPDQIAGASQSFRTGFFGMLKISVPGDIIEANNTVTVTFPDNGGHISAVTMQTLEFSREVVRRNAVTGIELYPTSVDLGIAQDRVLTATISPLDAADIRVEWTSSDASIVTVSEDGIITGQAIGSAVVTATTLDGGYQATCNVNVLANYVPVLVDSVIVTPPVAEVIIDDSIQLSYQVLPIDADDKTVVWSSEDMLIATVDTSGMVTAEAAGMVNINATASSGKFGASMINSIVKVPGFVTFDDRDKYLNTVYMVGDSIVVSCAFEATTGQTVNSNGVKFWLREIRPGWTVAADYTATDFSVVGLSEGTANAVISLKDAIPTSQLTQDHFYFLWISFTNEDGSPVNNNENVFPIQIEGSSSINDLKGVNVKLYPNPAQDLLYVKSDYPFSKATFYSITGQKIMGVSLDGSAINTKQLENGFHILELKGRNGERIIRKVLIQR